MRNEKGKPSETSERRRHCQLALCGLAALFVGCSDADDRSISTIGDAGAQSDAEQAESAPPDGAVASSDGAGGGDAQRDAHDAGNAGDAANACSVFGAPGECMLVSACTAMPDHSAFSGACTGGASVECCIDTPDVSDNPPIPTGYKLLTQSQVTPAMTTWAVSILHDPVTYPMYSTTTKTFGTLVVLARVEWHPPDFQNGVVHRGVTLYEPV